MSEGVGGDPASCSRLGGMLRSESARLVRQRERVGAPVAVLSRHAASGEALRRVEREVRLLESTADLLDLAGAALQRYAQELAEVSESARALRAEAARRGLEVAGWRVVEPWGVSSAERASCRQSAIPALQARADRLATQLGRARAALARTLTECTGALERSASTSRDARGRGADSLGP